MTGSAEMVIGGFVRGVEPGSFAGRVGVWPGDVLTHVNGIPVEDVIDVQFYAAEPYVELIVMRGDDELVLDGERRSMEPLGIDFEHPTFDTDIRRCNNLCEFCFVLQMAPRFRRTLYIKDDDYRYSFLFGHYVTLTNLDEHDEWRIVNQGLSPLYVSVHATDPTLHGEVLRNPDAPDIMEQLTWLVENGVDVHTQIVVTPGLNDGQHLEKSVHDLAALYPGVRSVSVVPVGLTRHHKYGKRPNTRAESDAILDACHRWQADFRERLGVNFVYATDEWYLVTGRPIPPAEYYDGLDLTENGLGMVRRFLTDWEGVQSELVKKPLVKRLTLGTAALFAPTLGELAAEFTARSGAAADVIPITNHRLGETITVAGLLMADDVIEGLHGRDLGEVVVLPRVMFDHPDGISLDDRSPLDIARALDRPVALADLMGDLVDIVYGKPALYFDPSGETLISPDDITLDGGWAVEKYL
jgi:putative radical SAM enzyme (TIGR03279 family)